MKAKPSQDRVDEILRASPPAFAAAMKSFVRSWRAGDADLSCVFVAMLEMQAQNSWMEEALDDMRQHCLDTDRELTRLRALHI